MFFHLYPVNFLLSASFLRGFVFSHVKIWTVTGRRKLRSDYFKNRWKGKKVSADNVSQDPEESESFWLIRGIIPGHLKEHLLSTGSISVYRWMALDFWNQETQKTGTQEDLSHLLLADFTSWQTDGTRNLGQSQLFSVGSDHLLQPS